MSEICSHKEFIQHTGYMGPGSNFECAACGLIMTPAELTIFMELKNLKALDKEAQNKEDE